MKQKKAHWRKLDNAAKLYSAASNKKDTRVFRFYCELKEQVQSEFLQEALDQTLETFPTFLMVLRKGLFWHYLEPCNLRPVVKEEYKEPCSRLYIRDKKTLLFEVTYYQKRINFEVFHVLTDGTGATEFLKELVKNYLYLAHKEEGLEQVSLQPEDMTVQDQEDDSFLKYYSKDQKRPKKRKLHAFQIRRKKKDGNRLHVHESIVSVQAILKRSRELGVSMTIFLTAIYMMAIHEEMSKMQKKRSVILMVPVNLRKFFPSTSMLNFFNWIEPGYDFATQDGSFEAVLNHTKAFFEAELTKEKMSAHISELLALELHPILRLAPLELKNLCIQAGAKFSENPIIQTQMMSIYIEQKEYEKAKEIGLKFPEEEKIQSQMIKIYMKEGNYVEAIKLGAEFPENPIIQSQMMSVYMRQGKYYRAKRIGEKFSWHKPIQLQLGKIYNILGQPKNDKPQIERNNAKIDNDTNKATNEDTISMESREILEWIETSQRTEAKSIVDEIKKQKYYPAILLTCALYDKNDMTKAKEQFAEFLEKELEISGEDEVIKRVIGRLKLKDEKFDRKYYENFLTEIEERKQESQEEMIR